MKFAIKKNRHFSEILENFSILEKHEKNMAWTMEKLGRHAAMMTMFLAMIMVWTWYGDHVFFFNLGRLLQRLSFFHRALIELYRLFRVHML